MGFDPNTIEFKNAEVEFEKLVSMVDDDDYNEKLFLIEMGEVLRECVKCESECSGNRCFMCSRCYQIQCFNCTHDWEYNECIKCVGFNWNHLI